MPNLFTDEDKTILFEGVDIEDDNQAEFMVKLESVITSQVSELKESFEAEKDDLIESYKEEFSTDMESKIDSYLDYVVESWVDDNEIALESGIKMEIMSGFMNGLKDLYEENNINMDEESTDIVARADEQVNNLQSDLADSLDTITGLKESLEDFKRGIVIAKHADGLTESDKEKLNTLVEGVEFGSTEVFNSKVKIIRESYFKEEKDEDDEDDDKKTVDKDKKSKKGDKEIEESYISHLAKLL